MEITIQRIDHIREAARQFVSIIVHTQQAADHPVSLNFPEGAYLKGLVLRDAVGRWTM